LIATDADRVRSIVAGFNVTVPPNIHPARLALAKANVSTVMTALHALREIHLPAYAQILNPAGGPLPRMSKFKHELIPIRFVPRFLF
jgi:hypothetical protein